MIFSFIQGIKAINTVVRDHPNAATWVADDFNLPDVNLETNTIEGRRYPYEINKNYTNMANDLFLTHVVDFPTCENATLDLFFTNRPSLVNQAETQPGISDHEIVYIDSCVNGQKVETSKKENPLMEKH